MIGREPLKRDPNAGRKPVKAVLRNLGAHYVPCSLAVRAGTAHDRPLKSSNLVFGAVLATGALAWWQQGLRPGAEASLTRAEGPVVAFGGDVNLGRRQNALTARHGPANALAGVPELAEAELSIVNLESVVAASGEPAGKGEEGPYYFRGRPEMLAVLSEAGIDVVGTANNHSGDYGPDALREQAHLLDRMNVAHAGSGPDTDAACAPAFRHAGDLRVAFFSIDATMPYFRATDEAPGTCYLPLEDATAWRRLFEPRVTAARKSAHVVFVGVHAGPNFEAKPDKQEVAVSRALIEAGADAVLGSSAHVLQGIEVYRGRPIVYDAGNLLFDFQDEDSVDSAVFSLVLDPRGVRQVWISPVTGRYGTTQSVDGGRARDILRALRGRSDGMGTELLIQGSEGVIELADLPARESSPEALSPDPPLRPPPDPMKDPPSSCTVPMVPRDAIIEPESMGPLTLVGASVEPTTITERTMLWVDTYWISESPISADLWIYLTGQPVDGTALEPWRGDHEPCDWMWPTSRWRPGVIYHDRYGARPPESLATTELEIRVGVLDEDRRLGSVALSTPIPVTID